MVVSGTGVARLRGLRSAGWACFFSAWRTSLSVYGVRALVGLDSGPTIPSASIGAMPRAAPKLSGSASGLPPGALTVGGWAAMSSLTGAILTARRMPHTMLGAIVLGFDPCAAGSPSTWSRWTATSARVADLTWRRLRPRRQCCRFHDLAPAVGRGHRDSCASALSTAHTRGRALSDAPNKSSPTSIGCWLGTEAAAASTRCWRPTARCGRIGAASSTAWRPRRRGPAAAAESTRRLLRESGIAFNVYADPDDRAHAWRLDLVPVLLPEREWDAHGARHPAARPADRSRAGDLYGDAKLLRDGSCCRPRCSWAARSSCAQRRPRRSAAPLPATYACDIARTADGSWVVLGDQTDTAIGNGYVLAWRVALSHGLAELFLDCHTRRLAGHYWPAAGAPGAVPARRRPDRHPEPGPDEPLLFQQRLPGPLSRLHRGRERRPHRPRQPGLPEDAGWPAAGLTIVCKQSGHFCDPLLLPGAGLLGVPGLVQAARSGQVAMVNRPGQRRAAQPRAGAVRRAGSSSGCWARTCCSRIRDLVAGRRRRSRRRAGAPERWATARRRAQRSGRARRRCSGRRRSTRRRDAGFEERLATRGTAGSALEPVPLATTPSFDGDRLRARRRSPCAPTSSPTRGRLAACCPAASSASPAADDGDLPNGFGSKDLWIAARRAGARQPSLLRTTMREVHLRRTGRDLLCRTADNLFWLGRYTERTEGTMRLLRSVLSRFLEDGRPDSNPRSCMRLLRLQLRMEPDAAGGCRSAGLGRRRGAGRDADVRRRAPTACATASTSCTAPRRWSATRSATTPGGC